MDIQTLVKTVNDWVWGPPLVILCLGTGVFFSIWTRFLQLRHIKSMVRQLWTGKASSKGISSFQGFAMALGGRVGTGNIAGVATAIAMGGPGALFWMWAIAFLGAGSAFIESTLAQVWKEKRTGEYRGGPSYYIEHGLGIKWFAIIFALAAVFSCGLLLPGIQSNSIANACAKGFNMPTLVSGIIVTALLALVIFGGAKRIGRVAELVVPFMALAYIIMAILIIIVDIHRVPEMLRLIFASAFGADKLFGGIVGSAIAWGVKRGIYSNEAGQGTGPQAAAAAEVAHPAQQGLVQAFSVYVDTLGVCTATGLMLLLTNQYNVTGIGGGFLVNNLPSVEHGPQYTQAAVDTIFPGFGSAFVATALFFFAFTTIMAYAYYAESNMAYLVRGRASRLCITAIRLGLLGMAFFGAMREADFMWAMGDIGVGLMAWLNLIAILALGGIGVKVLRDYERQLKNGGDISFEPEKLGIKNTECWGKNHGNFM
ncbi:MAG: alanine:cation symporter family protein [Holophagales bacterium]|jgi:AGCS family alanine or glycine:cation symporter|nr:alanine:cation symporter family protein [Holophagales bacterium]